MQTSSEIAKLATALAKAQGAIENATKDSTNPHFNRPYADLASVRSAIRQPLSEADIAYIQTARTVERGVEVETMLIHGESGEFVRDTLTMPLAQMTPQAVGSAITYGRRYSLMAMVGLAPEDDDANAAQAAASRENGRVVNPKTGRMVNPRSSRQAGLRGEWDGTSRKDGNEQEGWNPDNLIDNLRDCHSAIATQKLWDDYRANTYPNWPRQWAEEADAMFKAAMVGHTQDNLLETLEDSLAVEDTPTQNQIDTFRECVSRLRRATTPEDLKSLAANREYRRGTAILTEAQRADLRTFYSDTLTALQSQMLRSG